MTIKLKRIYDEPQKSDGTRLLVDRLWPRGMAKAKAKIDAWEKDLAPSSELRKWFHEDQEKRHTDFKKKYIAELRANRAQIKEIISSHKKPITLLSAVKDIDQSYLSTLAAFLKQIQK